MNNREYQVVQIDSIIQEVSLKRKVIGQLATGGGKTVEFSLICQRYIRNTGKAVLILVHRKELMYQAKKTIKKIAGLEPYLITSKTNKASRARVYIGMIDSLSSRLDLFSDVGLVIIDECHIANFNKIHSIFLEELIIGFSATPVSSSKKSPLNKFYNGIVTGPQINELIKLGFLSQNITRCPKEIVDSTKLSVSKLKGDFDEGAMAIEYSKVKHITNVLDNYYKFCKGKKTIIFNVNIEHSKKVNECFKYFGYNSRHLASDNEAERDEILKWFKETEDAILCNVMIATVGFDEPTVQSIILNFSTLSIVKFIQCSGRASRTIDDYFISNYHLDYPYKLKLKSSFDIIDMGGNCIRFGDWNDDRDWEYIYNHPDKPGEGIAPVKTCPECEGLVHASTMVCPLKNEKDEFCLHEFKRRVTPQEKDMEEMILITKGIDLDNLIRIGNNKYEYYPFFELAVDIVKSMYMEFPEPDDNIKIKYFKAYYLLCIEWYNKTLAGKDGNIKDITNSSWHIKRAKNNFDSLLKKYENYPLINI